MSKEEHGNDLVTAPTPPPLRRSLTDPAPVVLVGTLAVLLAFVSMLLVGAPALWTWSCLAGVGLGFFGYGVFRWQRAAARRGSRTAQEGLL